LKESRTVATHGEVRRRDPEQERRDAARREDDARQHALLALQQSAGNQAVSRLVQRRVKFGTSTKRATKAAPPSNPAIPTARSGMNSQ
jgi:hypothetical protein